MLLSVTYAAQVFAQILGTQFSANTLATRKATIYVGSSLQENLKRFKGVTVKEAALLREGSQLTKTGIYRGLKIPTQFSRECFTFW